MTISIFSHTESGDVSDVHFSIPVVEFLIEYFTVQSNKTHEWIIEYLHGASRPSFMWKCSYLYENNVGVIAYDMLGDGKTIRLEIRSIGDTSMLVFMDTENVYISGAAVRFESDRFSLMLDQAGLLKL